MNDEYKKSLPVILDKTQNKGVVSYWLLSPIKVFNKADDTLIFETYENQYNGVALEVYYKDGRTETIKTQIGLG